jgi:ABC-type transporter Mla subunit MlaD
MGKTSKSSIRGSFLGVVLIVVVGAAAAYLGYSGLRYHQSTVDESLREARLIRDIDRVSMIGNVLGLLEDGDEEKARELLEFYLRSTLNQVDRAGDDVSRVVSTAVPNLRVGVGRAREYAERHGMSDAAAQAGRLFVVLDDATERGSGLP